MKTILAITMLAMVGCQSATPNWAAISFALGDTIETQPEDNTKQKHPLE